MKHYLNIGHINQIANQLTHMEQKIYRIRKIKKDRIETDLHDLHDQIESIIFDQLPRGQECQQLDDYLQLTAKESQTTPTPAHRPDWISPQTSTKEMRQIHDRAIDCIRLSQLIKLELRQKLERQRQEHHKSSHQQEEQSGNPPEQASVPMSPQYLNWEFLPTGNDYGIYTTSCPAVRQYLEAMQPKFPKEYDQQRIDRVLTLGPDAWYCGKLKHDGYSIFVFKEKNAAILECPIYGNALYLVWGDWKKLSQMTKEKLRHYKGQGRAPSRFIHRDGSDWFFQLCRSLQLKPQTDSSQY